MILDEFEEVNLKALGATRLPNAADVEAEERLEALKKRQFVDLVVASELVRRGWRQATQKEGLLWCVVCNGPTIWKDETGRPMHHLCMEVQ